MKRFYKQAEVVSHDSGFGVSLDGKPVKTSAGHLLLCQKKDLAQYVADEWQAQEKEILPAIMPVNQIVVTSIDVTRSRNEIEDHILSYVDTDLLCYRSDTSPYREKQEEEWGKWTEWFNKRYGQTLKTTQAIEALKQETDVFEIYKNYIAKLDMLYLTLFESLVEDMSSPILALAFFEKAASADDLYHAVFVDDLLRAVIYNEALYGAAPDQEKKRKSVKMHLDSAAKILFVK